MLPLNNIYHYTQLERKKKKNKHKSNANWTPSKHNNSVTGFSGKHKARCKYRTKGKGYNIHKESVLLKTKRIGREKRNRKMKFWLGKLISTWLLIPPGTMPLTLGNASLRWHHFPFVSALITHLPLSFARNYICTFKVSRCHRRMFILFYA